MFYQLPMRCPILLPPHLLRRVFFPFAACLLLSAFTLLLAACRKKTTVDFTRAEAAMRHIQADSDGEIIRWFLPRSMTVKPAHLSSSTSTTQILGSDLEFDYHWEFALRDIEATRIPPEFQPDIQKWFEQQIVTQLPGFKYDLATVTLDKSKQPPTITFHFKARN